MVSLREGYTAGWLRNEDCFVKKVIAFLMIFGVFVSALMICSLAEGASVSLSASDSVCAGDTVMFRVRLSGGEISAFDGVLLYDPDKLSYQYGQDLPEEWEITLSASYGSIHIHGTDEKGKNPIRGESRIITLVFRVHDTLEDGDAIAIKASSFLVTDRETEMSLPDAEYTTRIMGAHSSDATLRDLSVRGATLLPEFSPEIFEYHIRVPFSTDLLDISYSAASGAVVTVSDRKLSVGENTVTLLVTAEDGSENSYSVLVTRANNPEYTPSGDASLSGILLSDGTLSPGFRWDIEAYVVYLPYETTELTVSGTPNHASARCADIENASLFVGDNVLRLVCTAEDGTERQYVLHAVRMPAFDGKTVVTWDNNGQAGDTESPAEGTESGSESFSQITDKEGAEAQTTERSDELFFSGWRGLLLPGLLILGIPLALLTVFLVRRHRKGKHSPKHA